MDSGPVEQLSTGPPPKVNATVACAYGLAGEIRYPEGAPTGAPGRPKKRNGTDGLKP